MLTFSELFVLSLSTLRCVVSKHGGIGLMVGLGDFSGSMIGYQTRAREASSKLCTTCPIGTSE